MSSNLENTSYHSILQQETYHKPTKQFISLGETLTDAENKAILDKKFVTRLCEPKFGEIRKKW